MRGFRIFVLGIILGLPLTSLMGQAARSLVAEEVREMVRTLAAEDVRSQLPRLRTKLRRDSYHWTPLMVAAAVATDPAVIHMLVAAGEDIDARSLDDMTPLMFASAFNPEVDIVDALLKAGASVDSRTRDNWVPSYGIARFTGANVEIGDLFAGISGAADQTEAREDGWTALFFAARHNPNEAVVERLLQAGADTTTHDEGGAPPIP